MEKTEQKQSINTPPSLSVKFEITGVSRNSIDVVVLVDDEAIRTLRGISTHMFYERLEVELGNIFRPLITKLLSQIKEHYMF